MSLNIPNLDKLIAHLEAQPPERINMAHPVVREHACGTCGCIMGHAEVLFERDFDSDDFPLFLGMRGKICDQLVMPEGWMAEELGARRYPANRVIATLKRLRDRFLATGEIVVDWGPEPGDEPAQPWSAPQAVELTPPTLPASITRLLAPEPTPAAEEI